MARKAKEVEATVPMEDTAASVSVLDRLAPELSTQPTLRRALAAIEVFHDRINAEFFGGKLTGAIWTIQSKKAVKGNARGWFTGNRMWKDAGAEDAVENGMFTNGYHELAISAEILGEGMKSVCRTIIHEDCHLYAAIMGIKDTSRNGSYHNEAFRKLAEGHGLRCEKAEKIGWTTPELTAEMDAWIDANCADLVNAFEYARREIEGRKREGVKKAISYRYVCPQCGLIARTTKECRMLCGDCSDGDGVVELVLG